MNAHFWHESPHQRARTKIAELLQKGTTQIAIANAFCTRAGVDFLLEHKDLLKTEDSFVVVASQQPTDLCDLNRLHKVTGSVYVHQVRESVNEKRVGNPLMHSKLFYARSGENCWLWTGSNNLTASALLGLNCEAAVMIEGKRNEKPFEDAWKHLLRCRDDADLYDYSSMCKEKPPKLLLVHAEAGEAISTFDSYVEVRFPDTSVDPFLKLTTRVVLFLYPPNTLHKDGMPDPKKAESAYKGKLDDISLTQDHPRKGLQAEYPANFSIEMNRTSETQQGVLCLGPPRKPSTNPKSQIVCHLTGRDDDLKLKTSLPRLQERYLESANRTINRTIEKVEIEQSMEKYFTKQSFGPETLASSESRKPHYKGSRYFHMTR